MLNLAITAVHGSDSLRPDENSLSVDAPLMLLQCVLIPGLDPRRGELRFETEARAEEKVELVFVWGVSRSDALCSSPH